MKRHLKQDKKPDFTKQRTDNSKDVDVLNGITRNETDRTSKKVLGNVRGFSFFDDFDVFSEMGSLSFINEGPPSEKRS